MWSDETTVWVVDTVDAKLYAYALSDGSRVAGRDITLDGENPVPSGVWSDETTVWVAERSGTLLGNKLYAYRLSDGARDSARDIDSPGAYKQTRLAGVWSDGETIWVAGILDGNPGKVAAYRLSDGARDSARDIDTVAASEGPTALWSDGTTMWVSDSLIKNLKVFAYNVPPQHSMPLLSPDARLSGLSVAPRDIIGFDPARTTAYQVGVGPDVGEATVTATANDAGASVSITGSADADPDTDGHQVSLSAGRNGADGQGDRRRRHGGQEL